LGKRKKEKKKEKKKGKEAGKTTDLGLLHCSHSSTCLLFQSFTHFLLPSLDLAPRYLATKKLFFSGKCVPLHNIYLDMGPSHKAHST
jgi:hypothetical protein